MDEKYCVIENRNIGLTGKPEFMETILFTGTKKDCSEYEDRKRKEYLDRTVVDCFVKSESELKREKEISDIWDNLTEEQKSDLIVVDGHTYVRAIYEMNHK